MAQREVPAPLRAFLYSCIDSVEQAELIVRLHGYDGGLSAGVLARELGISDAAARHHLEILVARGLFQTAIGVEVLYRYAPRSPELADFARQLVEFWGHSRSVLIHSLVQSRGPLSSFSKAFKLRKGE
jgi:hypothetical protein